MEGVNMDIRQLQYFITVAECLNFTEAAKRLYIVQSALSQQIVEIEKKIGVTLLERSKRSVKLTSAGHIFLKDAIDIVDRYNQALVKTRQTEQGLIGTLKVGFLSDSFSNFLPPLIQKFIGTYPNIDMKLTLLSNGPLMEKLSEDAIDLAFTINVGMHYVPNVDWLQISQDFVSVMVNRNHPLASEATVDFSKFSSERFIIMRRQVSPQGFDSTLQICANNGFSPKIVDEVNAVKDMLLLVASGIGVAILPNHIGKDYSNFVCCIPLEKGKYVVDLVAAWKKTNLNPSLPYFLDTLRSELKQE